MTAFWYVIVTLGILTAIINFGIAYARRGQPMVALVRGLAGVVSLVPPVGIVVGKALAVPHPTLQAKDVFIATGVFIFAVLLLPSYAEAWFNLANILIARDKLSEGEDALRRAIACKPDFADAHHNLRLLLQQRARPK